MEKTVSCLAQGGGEADFLLLQPLSHQIEKLHNFLKRPECWAVKCQGWISSTSGLYFGIWMKKKQHQHHLNAKHKLIKMFYFFRMMCDLWINQKILMYFKFIHFNLLSLRKNCDASSYPQCKVHTHKRQINLGLRYCVYISN